MASDPRLMIHNIRDVTIVNLNESSILESTRIGEIGEALFELIDGKACRKLIIDFSKVKFMSSSAIGVLITLQKKSSTIKGKLILCALRPDLKRIFDIMKLNKMFDFQVNEDSALKAFGVTAAG